MRGVTVCEAARTPQELAETIEGLVHPIAPTVRVYASDQPPASATRNRVDPAGEIIAWRHAGVRLGKDPSVYTSVRVKNKPGTNNFPDPDKPYVANLGVGVTCCVPLALSTDEKGTLPHTKVDIPKPTLLKPEGFRPNGNDRTTRLADVALAWTV